MIFFITVVGTNGQGHELFVCVCTVNGEGFPISYLSLSKITAPGAKIVALAGWFSQLKRHGIDPEFVSTDKDAAEIAAVQSVWPSSKIQLCWWHVEKAIDKRLRKNKDPDYSLFDRDAFAADCANAGIVNPFDAPVSHREQDHSQQFCRKQNC